MFKYYALLTLIKLFYMLLCETSSPVRRIFCNVYTTIFDICISFYLLLKFKICWKEFTHDYLISRKFNCLKSWPWNVYQNLQIFYISVTRKVSISNKQPSIFRFSSYSDRLRAARLRAYWREQAFFVISAHSINEEFSMH